MSKSAHAEIYVSTDIETDGPIPATHSMISLASAAYSVNKELLATFSVNIEPLPTASVDPATQAWWQTQPRAWAAATKDPQPAKQAMQAYVQWIDSLPGDPIFVGYPAGFDFSFVYWYLMQYIGSSPFCCAALDIKTYAMATLKREYRKSFKEDTPAHLLDDLPHTHIALDDAIEQGAWFCNLLALNHTE